MDTDKEQEKKEDAGDMVCEILKPVLHQTLNRRPEGRILQTVWRKAQENGAGNAHNGASSSANADAADPCGPPGSTSPSSTRWRTVALLLLYTNPSACQPLPLHTGEEQGQLTASYTLTSESLS